MDWNDGSVGWTAWFAMAAMMVVFWGLVIVAVVVVARSLGGHRDRPGGPGGSGGSGRDAFQILDERLARGEIDLEEYHRRRDALLRRTHEPS